MANTFSIIQSATVGVGGAAGIEFGSIPQTYTDLLVVASLRGDAAVNAQIMRMKINGSTANLSTRLIFGNASTASTASVAYLHVGNTGGTGTTANVFSSHTIYLPNYTGSHNKSINTEAAMENNSMSDYVTALTAGLWSQTAAITSVELYPDSGSFVQYSSASLYGIKNS